MTTPSPRATTVNRQRTLADTARRLAAGPVQLRSVDADALATLDALGLVARSGSYCQLNVSKAPGSAISALARGDLKRAAAYARIKRPAA
jgi:hypothetical protein